MDPERLVAVGRFVLVSVSVSNDDLGYYPLHKIEQVDYERGVVVVKEYDGPPQENELGVRLVNEATQQSSKRLTLRFDEIFVGVPPPQKPRTKQSCFAVYPAGQKSYTTVFYRAKIIKKNPGRFLVMYEGESSQIDIPAVIFYDNLETPGIFVDVKAVSEILNKTRIADPIGFTTNASKQHMHLLQATAVRQSSPCSYSQPVSPRVLSSQVAPAKQPLDGVAISNAVEETEAGTLRLKLKKRDGTTSKRVMSQPPLCIPHNPPSLLLPSIDADYKIVIPKVQIRDDTDDLQLLDKCFGMKITPMSAIDCKLTSLDGYFDAMNRWHTWSDALIIQDVDTTAMPYAISS